MPKSAEAKNREYELEVKRKKQVEEFIENSPLHKAYPVLKNICW